MIVGGFDGVESPRMYVGAGDAKVVGGRATIVIGNDATVAGRAGSQEGGVLNTPFFAEAMMRTIARLARIAAVGTLCTTTVAQAQATKEQQTLAAALGRGKFITLGAGIAAATPSGRPISSRYEVENGKLQLSVFVEKGGAFSEVFVDQVTGHVAKIDKITGGDDLRDAKAQIRALAKAKSTIATALDRALAANPECSAVDITPVLEGGRPVAEITLMKQGKFNVVSQPLG